MRHRTLLTGILLFCSTFITTTVFALPTFKFFVEDSTQPSPKRVGFVISVSTEIDPFSLFEPNLLDLPRHVLTLVPKPKVEQPQIVLADWWKIGLRINPDEIPYFAALHFTSTDCTGTAWIADFIINAEFVFAFDPHAVIGDSVDPNVRTLYAADPDAPFSATMDFNSILRRDFGCGPIARTVQAKPAILLFNDLHQTFPPPYSLNFEFIPESPAGSQIHKRQLVDSNLASCEATDFPTPPFPATHGWCPNDSRTTFIIPEPLVTNLSVVMVNRVLPPGGPGVPFDPCVVRLVNSDLKAFRIDCFGPVPNGAVINYAIIP